MYPGGFDHMKYISVVLPAFNEEENVIPLASEIITIFNKELSDYLYEIIFLDNYSTDNTRNNIRLLCSGNKNIKAIFNARNFHNTSLFHGITQAFGDCVVVLDADFQDPPSLIPKFVAEWEKGYKVIMGIDSDSKENIFMRSIRNIFHHIFYKVSDFEYIKHFHGVGLYDKLFIDVIRNLHDPYPEFRGIVGQLGMKKSCVHYQRQKRRTGKSSFNFYGLYDTAMRSFTSYTRIFLRIPIFIGFLIATLSFFIALYYFILKFLRPEAMQWGIAAVVVGVFLLGGIQLIFIGLLGEYVMAINTRVMNRPWVIEEERLNFE
jgi:glycosyltransferase involved in cell wall biosynthesis